MTGQLDLFHQPPYESTAPKATKSEDKPPPRTQITELAGTTWEHAFGCQIDESAGQDTR